MLRRTPMPPRKKPLRPQRVPSKPGQITRAPIKRRRKKVSWHHGSAAGLRHMVNVKSVGCVLDHCGRYAEAHHPLTMRRGSRASDFDTIALCFDHHSHQSPLPHGEAIHKGTETFCAKYGTEPQLLEKTRAKLRRAGLDDGAESSARVD